MVAIDPGAVAFDVDGVVADTMSLFIDIARAKHNIHGLSKEQMTSYALDTCLPLEREIITDIVKDLLAGTYQSPLEPMPGAVEVLARLAQAASPLIFVTARPSAALIEEWLRRVLPLEPEKINVIATGTFLAKTETLLKLGRLWFVEDRMETCFLLHEAGIKPVVFRQPWNREPHPFLEVGSWQELGACMAVP